MNNLRKLIKQTLLEMTQSQPNGLQKISLQQAMDKSLFGPVYHGSSQENIEKIGREGFKIFYGKRGDDNVSHGYPDQQYALGYPPPVHHLGYGIYFTTVKSIAKRFNRDTTKGIKEFYLNAPRVLEINFASSAKMMQWWLDNGYDGELAKTGEQGRVEATKKLTDHLKSQYDAVWFKGKGFKKLLDGDQIVIFNPEKIYMIDYSLSREMEIGSKVIRKENKYRIIRTYNTDTGESTEESTQIEVPAGAIGIIISKESTSPMIQHWKKNGNTNTHWAESSKYVYKVKWNKGGTEFNALDKHIQPYKKNVNEGYYTTWKSIIELDDLGPSQYSEGVEELEYIKDDIVQKLSKHFNIKKTHPLGSGTQGYAYYIPNNKVLKITTDKSEAADANKIKGKKLKHLSNIYGVYALKGRYDGFYVVVSEFINKSERIDNADQSLADFLDSEFGYSISYFFEDYSNGSITKDEIKDYIRQIKEFYKQNPNESAETIWYMTEKFALIDEIRVNKIISTDWGLTNIGLKKDGHLAMYDFGYGNLDAPDVQNINLNEIKPTEDVKFKYGRYTTKDGKAYADVAKSKYQWHIEMIESSVKGGGTIVVNKIINDAKKAGVKKITLTTTEFSGWEFFDKMGFKEIGDKNDPHDIPMEFKLDNLNEFLGNNEYPDFFDGQFNSAFHAYPPVKKINNQPLAENIISSEEINKKELPYIFSHLFDDFVTEKTEVEVRVIAPTIDLNQKPSLLMMSIEINYPSLFDTFADWLFDREKNVTTMNKNNN